MKSMQANLILDSHHNSDTPKTNSQPFPIKTREFKIENEEVLVYGPIKILEDQRRCYKNNELIELTRREFNLLTALVENLGRVLNRRQLLKVAWENSHISTKTIDVHIANLRKKLGEELRISSLRGIGYRLEPICS